MTPGSTRIDPKLLIAIIFLIFPSFIVIRFEELIACCREVGRLLYREQ